MSDIRFFNLSIPAPKRLQMMREAFANHGAKYPRCPEYAKPKTWRDVRAYGLHTWESAFCTLDQAPGQWYAHTGEQFRRECFADEMPDSPIDHRGWHTMANGDTFKDGTGLARGIVARLPHGRFIAGYFWGDNGERVYFPEVHTCPRDAARAADSHAESFAESAREDSERFDRMQDAESAVQDAIGKLRDTWALRRKGRRTSDRVRDAIEALREARAEFIDAVNDYEKAR
jgi:hypothetical protein